MPAVPAVPAVLALVLLAAGCAGGAGGPGDGIRREPLLGRLIIAIDDIKALADEEMKVVLDGEGMLVQITKVMDPACAHGEYMGVTLIEPAAAVALADCLETTWRRNPHLYYEDGFAEFSERGGAVLAAPIGAVEWVEVDDHADLMRAREIAARC